MVLYKYINPKWADEMTSRGSVRIGTLYGFRTTETLGGERGDQHEGVRISLTDGKAGFIRGEDLPWFVKESLRVPDGVVMKFDEGGHFLVHQHAPNVFVFCACSRYDANLMKLFGGACIEITEPRFYFDAITKALEGWTPEGVRRITGFQLAPCQYLPREQTWPNVVPYNPIFRKAPAYEHQMETRAVWWTPLTLIEPENLLVPEIRHFCRRIA